MPKDRHEEKEDLFYMLGLLFGPVQGLIARGKDATPDEWTRILAQYSAEQGELVSACAAFSRSEPGHNYSSQYSQFRHAVLGFANQAGTKLNEVGAFFDDAVAKAKEALRSIPVLTDSVIFETNTPFTTYAKLKTLCNLAQMRITFVDRYLNQSVFYRYLRDIDDDVLVTLVCPKHALTDDFLDVSRLFAQERGSAKYCLTSNPKKDIHDRWLHLDDDLYQLGNSTAEAAVRNDFTISKVDPTPENTAKVTDKIKHGTEQFGLNNTNHPNHKSDLK